MNIDLAGRHACLIGEPKMVLDAIAAALQANGCAVHVSMTPTSETVPDILISGRKLRSDRGRATIPSETAVLDEAGEVMHRRGSGRIVLLLSALAAVPARRFPDASISAGAELLYVRTLAMRLGPAVLINAVGCGAIADGSGDLVSGDPSMLSHVPTGQPGAIADIVHAVLFLCDPMNSYLTGQMLTVDGGWSAGYGRNF